MDAFILEFFLKGGNKDKLDFKGCIVVEIIVDIEFLQLDQFPMICKSLLTRIQCHLSYIPLQPISSQTLHNSMLYAIHHLSSSSTTITYLQQTLQNSITSPRLITCLIGSSAMR